MQVKRDFEEIYRQEDDPWKIGNADSERYNLYFEKILKHLPQNRGLLLDVGSGFGAFLSRFHNKFANLVGIELSQKAIQKGKGKYPFIEFHSGNAADLTGFREKFSGRCDTLIYSDVIYYLNDRDKHQSLKTLATYLAPDGIAFIAAWCPGGDYLEYDELRNLVMTYFRIVEEGKLPSNHGYFIAKKKRNLLALTIDYETWHPIPPGKSIDWKQDVFEPTARLFDLARKKEIHLTIMAEMGEYFWLKKNSPNLAQEMESQWKLAISHGHDVQLHLHPNWLPELGAKHENGQWWWDWSKSNISDYPGDLTQLVGRCKLALENLLKPVHSGYQALAFRAGAYQAQPFKKLHEALKENGIFCDSSVYAGGVSKERGYDYSLAYSRHQPYFASPYDPQLKALPVEKSIIEIPIFTYRFGQRWFLDENEGPRMAEHLLVYAENSKSVRPTGWFKFTRRILGSVYGSLGSAQRWVNRLLPKSLAYRLTHYGPLPECQDQYFVMIGHTKASHDLDAIADNIDRLKQDGRFEFVTLSEMAAAAQSELTGKSRSNAEDEARFQVQREYQAIMGDVRNEAQSFYLQERIPWDRDRILDLGCGTGYWSKRISDLLPWTHVTGIDCGEDFIQKAQSQYQSTKIDFRVEDFGSLSFREGEFDCVYADNTLEHAFDVDQTLKEIHRVLRNGGCLIAALPSDARNPGRITDNHNWKTAPHEVRLRLEATGFKNIEIQEIDTLRRFGMPPYPPSHDRMMYITAWKQSESNLALARADNAMQWVSSHLNPDHSQHSNDPALILKEGFAFCWGYVVVLGALLKKEGYKVRWITMLAENHPRGRGPQKIDSHEIVEVKINGKPYVFDPMANTSYPYSFAELLKTPSLATGRKDPDGRYKERHYELYDTGFWYQRIVRYAIRNNYKNRIWRWSRADNLRASGSPSKITIFKTEPPASPPLAGENRLSFQEFRQRLLSFQGLSQLFFYDEAVFFSYSNQVLQKPLMAAILLKLLSRRSAVILDETGRGMQVSIKSLARFFFNFLRDGFQKPFLLANVKKRVQRNFQLDWKKGLSLDLPPVYLKTDMSFGIRAGGSVAHVSGVLNNLNNFAADPIFVSSDGVPLIKTNIETHIIPPQNRFFDFRDGPSFYFNDHLSTQVDRVLKGRDISFVYQRYSLNNFSGVELAAKKGVPFVLEFNGSEVWIGRNWGTTLPYEKLSQDIESLNLQKADLIVVVSEILKNQLVDRGIASAKILVDPNGVDTNIYSPSIDGSPVRKKLGTSGKTVVGFMGTFGPWHGVEVLARAAGELFKSHPELKSSVHFLIIGDGNLRPSVQTIIDKENITDQVTLPGLVPQAAGPDYLAACDLLVASHVPNPDGSPFFGSPTKLFEYMAMGKGIVASNLEQLGTILKHEETAWLVRPGDVKDLAAGIYKLIVDRDLRTRMGVRAREVAIQRYTWKEHTRRIIEALKEIQSPSYVRNSRPL